MINCAIVANIQMISEMGLRLCLAGCALVWVCVVLVVVALVGLSLDVSVCHCEVCGASISDSNVTCMLMQVLHLQLLSSLLSSAPARLACVVMSHSVVRNGYLG